jgi:chaperonin cofactor prefoldin
MDKTQKDEFIQLINQGIQEVVIPAMEDLENHFDKKIELLHKEINYRFDEVDKKLDRLENRDDRLADEQVDIRTRLRRVENAVFKKID